MGDLKSAINLNICSLFDDAELLASKEHYGSAIHLIMAAREESVKWILVHCWVYLKDDLKKKIFNHQFKHKTAAIFYYMSGQLHSIDLVFGALELLKDSDPKISGAAAAIINLLSEIMFNQESIAKAISSSLSGMPNEAKEITEKREIAVTKLIDDTERMRQNSIYVDFDQALNVYGQPQNFVNNDYEKVRKDVIRKISYR